MHTGFTELSIQRKLLLHWIIKSVRTRRRLMSKRKYLWAIAACVAAATPFVSSVTFAGKIDGAGDITCAVMDVVGCTEGGCVQGTASSFDLPVFIILDAKKKHLKAAYESEHKDLVSPIKNIERNGTHLILQGVENNRGWDIAINTNSGKMQGSGVGDNVSFLVFGACTAH